MRHLHRIDSQSVVDFIIGPPNPKYRWLSRLALGLLFFTGLYLWGAFLNWGQGPLTFHDWAEIFSPRLAVMGQALRDGELLLHTSKPVIDEKVTLRYLSIPDQILSPQVLLLRWLDVGRFILVQYWLMYALGFWAMLKFRQRFQLSILAFTILFVLYNFNGHILAHTGVGHINWSGYFLYLGFALLIFELLEGHGSWLWVAKVTFLSLFIFLQGSYHMFIWLLFFCGLLALSVPQHFWWLLATSVFAVLVSSVRILPAVLLLGKIENRFLAGYQQVQSVWYYMIEIQEPQSVYAGLAKAIGSWEYTLYVGILGTAFILYFGVLRPLKDAKSMPHMRILYVPILGLALLSMNTVFGTLREILPIPLFTGERVASRMIILAYVFILIGAVIAFQRWLDHTRLSHVGITSVMLLIALGLNDLHRDYVMWSVLNVANYFEIRYIDLSSWGAANQWDDTPYLLLLGIGLLVSLISAGALLFLAWREKRRKSTTEY